MPLRSVDVPQLQGDAVVGCLAQPRHALDLDTEFFATLAAPGPAAAVSPGSTLPPGNSHPGGSTRRAASTRPSHTSAAATTSTGAR